MGLPWVYLVAEAPIGFIKEKDSTKTVRGGGGGEEEASNLRPLLSLSNLNTYDSHIP